MSSIAAPVFNGGTITGPLYSTSFIRLNGNGTIGFTAGLDPTAGQSAGFSLPQGGIISVDTSLTGNSQGGISDRYTKVGTFTVATLPPASSVGVGARAFVTDATVTTFASVVIGGGANAVPVTSDGTNWKIG